MRAVARWCLAAGLLGGGLVLMYPGPAVAGGGKGEDAPLTRKDIGMVDMTKVYDASDVPQLVQMKRQQVLQNILQIKQNIQAASYFTQKELSDYVNAITDIKITPEEQKQAADLKTLSDQRTAEMQKLSQLSVLTDAQKAREKELAAESNDTLTALSQIILPELESDGDQQIAKYRQDQMEQLWDIAGSIAKKKGIAALWQRGTLIYSSQDITPDVIKQVQHK